MSVICRTFVQNAWRSDLCSNCFKSLEDHTDHGTARRNNVCEKLSMPRYVPQAATLYQSRGISTSLKWRLNESLYDKVSRRDFASQTPKTAKVSQQPEPPIPSSRGILIKTDSTSSEKKYKSRPSVDFASEEALVIGYGGNDYDSDTSPWEMGSDDGSIDFDLLDDTDEDRNITRLTKNNTEFNSFNKNLLSGDGSPNQVTKEEEKLNTINNHVNNQVKNSDKSISILTYNDIQSTKADKKLNQYFFPSSTEIKSYLNGHGSPLIEDVVLKNNNEKSQINAKVQNYKRETEKKDNMNAKISLNEDFTPLNTRTYCFVSELSKSSVNFEPSSDSDYSTCRHTPGDSTDSESFHDAEETRPLPKLSFLHGTYTVSSPQIIELDIDKKYDAGSSTSGDVSNFSDDSDTHDSSDRTSYKIRNMRAAGVPTVVENKQNQKEMDQNVDLNKENEKLVAQNLRKQEEISVQLHKKEELKTPNKLQKDSSPKTDSKKHQQPKCSPKSRQPCPIARPEDTTITSVDEESLSVSLVVNDKDSSAKIITPESDKDFLKYVSKENGFSTMVSKSASMSNIHPSSNVIEIKRSPTSKNKEVLKQEVMYKSSTLPSKSVKEEITLNNSSSNLQDAVCRDNEPKQRSSPVELSEETTTEDDDSKEQTLKDSDFIDYEDNSDYEKSPEAINSRQSKLAALALELEQARRDSESKANKPPSPPAPIPPPEVRVRYSKASTQINPSSSPENLPTIKKPSAISCCSRLSSLPDVLQETPVKQKKSKFSLKKLLKRNKDSGTFSPGNKEVNPKAWKKQTFDRNRLSLEILHPMDLTSDVPTSADTTPTEEHKQIVSTHPGKFMFKGVSNRARSLSALPQLSSDEQSGCALIDCRKMDTVPMRKAGTVVERKKNRLSKSSVNFEPSSDSDYSTCRHTPGDSTDSESFHDAEETRPLPKLSFLHGTYTVSSPQIIELDIDKKYDAGSSTSGDVSNFSDDSDTHDSSDRTSYKIRNMRAAGVPTVVENKQNQKEMDQNVDLNKENEKLVAQNLRKQEEISVQLHKKEELKTPNKLQKDSSPKTDSKKHQQPKCSPKSRQPCPIARPEDTTITSVDEESLSVSLVVNDKDSSAKIITPESDKDFLKYVSKENGFSTMVSKSASMSNIHPSSNVIEIKRSPTSKNKEVLKQEVMYKSSTLPSKSVKEEITLNNSSSNLQDAVCRDNEPKQRSSPVELSEETTTEDDDSKEQTLKDSDFIDYEDNSDYEKSPEAINSRQSKLAALALELEQARRDSESKANKPPSPPAPIPPPEVRVRYSKASTQINPSSSPENLPTIKKPSAISCCSRLSSLPDVLQETPVKQKKSKFSLKKLLKRNKDSGTFSPGNKEVNPKAWKKQTFDRNRLSLEILHPMDLTSDVPTSADTTPTEEHKQIVSTHPGKFMFKGVSNRARSLSALPQLSSDEQSGCALIDCRKMDTVPMRKAGTVVERKKNRPALVRTPSCSALPNRSTSAGNSPAHYGSNDRTPPPKPPPPPKCKVMHPPPPPPPPHSHPRAIKTNSVSPARPPPPKVPENKSRSHSSGSSAQELREQNHSDKEYANLGDIRSLLTPKKPQRPSAFSASSRGDSEIGPKTKEDIYETLPATVEEEEDHYTYLDEAEVKASKSDPSKKSAQKVKSCTETAPCGRPWLDLQTSYAAIAAANYESLAELITTSLNESAEYFKKAGQSLKWRDFLLDSQEHYNIIKEKAVYNAMYKNDSQDKVTLVVAPRKQTTPQNAKSQTRYPVLASFNDHVPKNFISTDNYILQESEMASIYILQQSKVTTVSNFAQMSSSDLANQHIHLRNYCFVLLQLIHTLKSLQAEGIEEINYDLQILILVVTDEEKPPILVLFPEDKIQLALSDLSNRKTLCQATLQTMMHFLQINEIEELKTCVVNGELLAEPVAHTFRAIAKVLSEEKASSLSQAKGFLEYMLWGPVDVKISQNDSENILDTILQRWLDLQRAQMVKSTISHLQNRKKLNESLHVYEEYQLIFLLQASTKSLKNVISKL